MGLVSTGYRSPTNANNAGVGTPLWTNPSNALSSDNVYASGTLAALQGTDRLITWGYGFTIPTQVQILGIEVQVERQSQIGLFCRDYEVKMVKAQPNVVGSDNAQGGYWTVGTDQVIGYGNQLYLWGTTWTPDEINSANFGCSFRAINDDSGGGAIALVDRVQIQVSYYTHSLTTMMP